MEFCSQCGYMYYIKLDDDKKTLVYYCRNCGNEDNILTEDNVCVLHTDIQQKTQRYKQVINEYTKHDPTLPRISSIKCPNHNCRSNIVSPDVKDVSEEKKDEDTNSEIIYIRYDDINMNYIYMCDKCNVIWKTDEQH